MEEAKIKADQEERVLINGLFTQFLIWQDSVIASGHVKSSESMVALSAINADANSLLPNTRISRATKALLREIISVPSLGLYKTFLPAKTAERELLEAFAEKGSSTGFVDRLATKRFTPGQTTK